MNMSLLSNSLLEVPLQNAIEIYNKQVTPRLTTKNKVLSISVAIALTLVYKIIDSFKPPKHLRHIPYQSYFGFIRTIIKKEQILERSQKFSLPFINLGDNNGIYLKRGRKAWEVHVTNPEDVKQVFLKYETFQKYAFIHDLKGTSIEKFFGGGRNILFLNGDEWKAQRKITNPAFRRSMPVNLFGRLTEQLFIEMDRMEETIEFVDLMERWTLDAIGRAGFGFNFNAVSERENYWATTFEHIMIDLRSMVFGFFPILERRFLWLFPKRQAFINKLDSFIKMIDGVIYQKRLEVQQGHTTNDDLQENEKDLLTLMLESEMRGEGIMNDEELRSNILVFFFAGHDTTASALSFAIYYLAKHQDIQSRAREESISILGDEPFDVLPTIEDTKEMEYLNCVIKENLRICDPVPISIPRVASEDIVLSNTFIPKGTPITVNVFDTHHCEHHWSDSFKFNPERFAEGGEYFDASNSSKPYVPFGNGSRQCIGMNFSLNEQRVLLSMMLRKYTWTLPEDSIHKESPQTTGFNVITPVNLKINFTRRY